jgi:uncharacterized protein YjiK
VGLNSKPHSLLKIQSITNCLQNKHITMAIAITEYSYTSANGEFFELTNTGTTAVDLTGWSFDDNTRTIGSFSLSTLGIVKAGESVIITETVDVNAFRAAWGIPATVKILSGSNQGLGRADEINIYDGGGVLIDRLTYNDEAIAGSVRTQNVSASTDLANLGKNDATKWKLAVVGDAQGSVLATGGDIGNPGRYVGGTAPAPLAGIDLSTYTRIGRYDLPEPTRTNAPTGSLLAQEVSAVTYNVDTDTLFVVGDGGTSIVQVSKTGQLIDSMTLALGTSPQGTTFYDPEGLTYIGGGKFVMVEERDRQAVSFTYAKDTTLTRANTQTVKLGTTIGNIGIEGISYDPQTSGYIAVKEESPQGVFQTTINFAAGTASNGSATTVNSTNLFDPTLAGLADLADVFALSNVTALNGKADAGNLLLLSQASGKVVEVDRTGKILSSLTITTDAGNPLSIPDQQHEGLTVDKDGILYVVSENGGGSIDRPQLWVYAPSTGTPNPNPTPNPTPSPTPIPAPSPNPNLFISEVTPWASGNAPYAADWFEVTNTGTTAVDITGWKIDDNSNAFANAVALRGVTSIAAGKSAVFFEGDATGSTDAAIAAAFSTAWFGSATLPDGFLLGSYGGAGVGLSTGGDSVNLYNASGSLVTGVSFGASPTASPFATFDNKAGLGGTATLPTISTLSVAGTNGAILAADKIEIGSPGSIANINKPPADANNLLSGTTGADRLEAGITPKFTGNGDTVFTGAGNDNVDIAIAGALAGNNRIDLGSGADVIFIANTDRAFGSAGDDEFEASEAQGYRVSGGAGNDTFFLGSNGRALGGDGNDRLFVGAGGGNLLSGGAGADQFWIANAELPAAANTILDFQIGTDVIGIQGAKSLGFSATTLVLSQIGDDTSINFGGQSLALLKGIQASSLTPSNAGQFVFA